MTAGSISPASAPTNPIRRIEERNVHLEIVPGEDPAGPRRPGPVLERRGLQFQQSQRARIPPSAPPGKPPENPNETVSERRARTRNVSKQLAKIEAKNEAAAKKAEAEAEKKAP